MRGPKFIASCTAILAAVALSGCGATGLTELVTEYRDLAEDKKAELAADGAEWQCLQSDARRDGFVDDVNTKLTERGTAIVVKKLDCDGNPDTPE